MALAEDISILSQSKNNNSPYLIGLLLDKSFDKLYEGGVDKNSRINLLEEITKIDCKPESFKKTLLDHLESKAQGGGNVEHVIKNLLNDVFR
jgi:hypothetical protein